MSCVSCGVSCVSCGVSCVSCDVSCVSCDVSCVSCDVSYSINIKTNKIEQRLYFKLSMIEKVLLSGIATC